MKLLAESTHLFTKGYHSALPPFASEAAAVQGRLVASLLKHPLGKGCVDGSDGGLKQGACGERGRHLVTAVDCVVRSRQKRARSLQRGLTLPGGIGEHQVHLLVRGPKLTSGIYAACGCLQALDMIIISHDCLQRLIVCHRTSSRHPDD